MVAFSGVGVKKLLLSFARLEESMEVSMKVVAIIGSPRRNGNTELLAAHALKAMAEEGIETELVPLAGLDIRGCTACMACSREEDCTIQDDLWPVYEKMKAADGIILASPVYYGSCTALLKG